MGPECGKGEKTMQGIVNYNLCKGKNLCRNIIRKGTKGGFELNGDQYRCFRPEKECYTTSL